MNNTSSKKQDSDHHSGFTHEFLSVHELDPETTHLYQVTHSYDTLGTWLHQWRQVWEAEMCLNNLKVKSSIDKCTFVCSLTMTNKLPASTLKPCHAERRSEMGTVTAWLQGMRIERKMKKGWVIDALKKCGCVVFNSLWFIIKCMNIWQS